LLGRVASLRVGWSPGRARLPFHVSFTSHQGWRQQFHARFTPVSRGTNGTERVAPDWIKEPRCDSTSRSQRPVERRCIPHFRMQFPADIDLRHLRNRMIPTVRFQILKYCRGNCMRLLRSCTRYGALHPISGHYTRSGRVQCSLIGCTASSATSCGADTRQGQLGPHQQDRHYAPFH